MHYLKAGKSVGFTFVQRPKRTYEEVDVGGIKDASSELQIRGMLGDVSPIKKGKSTSYFHGEMTDGRGKFCLYGFDDNIRKRLSEASGTTTINKRHYSLLSNHLL